MAADVPEFTPALGASICSFVGNGVDLADAAATEGVSLQTLQAWCDQGRAGVDPYAQFVRDLAAADATGASRLKLHIVKSSAEDWRAAAWCLDQRTKGPAAAEPPAQEGERKPLTHRMRAFVREYVAGRNGAEAARRAGYAENAAKQAAYKLLQRPEVLAEIRAVEEAEERLVGSRRNYVINRLHDLVERSMQAQPVRNQSGKKVGIYKQDGATATRALELLGKHEGMFNDRIDVRVQGEVEALLEGVRALMSQSAYAELVRAIAEVSGIAGMDPAAAPGDRGESAVH